MKRLSFSLFLLALVALVPMFYDRFFYPFELEWMEGEIENYLATLSEGKSLYSQPAFLFTPFLYNFLFFDLCNALEGALLPLQAGRLLSLLSLLAVLVCLLFLGKRSGSPGVGFLAAFFYLISFEVSGAWYDLARVDGMLNAILALCLVLIARDKFENTHALLLGILLFVAFLVKQSALSILVAFTTLYLGFYWRRALVTVSGCLIPVMVVIQAMDRQTAGWYSYYIFELPGRHKYLMNMFHEFWWGDLLGNYPVFFPMALIGVFVFFWRLKNGQEGWVSRVLAFSMACVFCSYLSRLHNGGYFNVLMPAILVLCFFGAFFLVRLWEFGYQRTFGVLLMIQVAVLVFNPFEYVPHKLDLEANQKVVRILEKSEGPVWVPYHSYLARRAGKPPHAHILALVDVKQGDKDGSSLPVEQQMQKLVSGRVFSVVILDQVDRFSIGRAFLQNDYKIKGALFDHQWGYPVSGYKTRPFHVLVPR